MRTIDRRQFMAMAAALLGAPDLRAAEQPPAKAHLGLLSIGTDPLHPQRWQPLFDALQAMGYAEGRNLVVRRNFADGNFDRLPRLAADLAAARVDIIVTTGDREIHALNRVTNAIPIIMTFASDPVGSGFVRSLARPGGNITGIATFVPGQIRKHVELLREMIPAAGRFAVLVSSSNPALDARREYEAAAQTLGMTMFVAHVPDRRSYSAVLEGVKKKGAAAIIAPMDGETFSNRRELAQLAISHRLPVINADRAYVDEGGLISLSSSFADRLRRAAVFVDKILRGAKPADMPVELPTIFELVVNRRTARALGLDVPQSILIRADEVID